jgi:hypothetical protein
MWSEHVTESLDLKVNLMVRVWAKTPFGTHVTK